VGGLRFRSLSAGGTSTCGVTTDDALYCWGANFLGMLGDGTTINRLTPVRIGGPR
jgi:alpha-tubulin suppressor-like RCC1 family protein